MPTNLRREQLTLLKPGRLAQAILEFLLDCEARQLSPRTLEFYRSELGHFRQFLAGLRIDDAEAIEATHIRAYLADLASHRSAGGIHAMYRAIKAFLRWYWNEYEIERPCPIAKVRAPKLPSEPLEPVPIDDLRAMLATCDRSRIGTRDRALLLALLDSGCRAAEFLALNIGDVDMKSGSIVIRHGKGDKTRVTFFGTKTRRELVRYLRHRSGACAEPAEALWCTLAGERLTYWGLRQLVRRRAEAAGVPVPAIHSFRRAFALMSLRAGMDVYSLQRLMGHSDLGVLRRYLAQTQSDLQAAHGRASPADRL